MQGQGHELLRGSADHARPPGNQGPGHCLPPCRDVTVGPRAAGSQLREAPGRARPTAQPPREEGRGQALRAGAPRPATHGQVTQTPEPQLRRDNRRTRSKLTAESFLKWHVWAQGGCLGAAGLPTADRGASCPEGTGVPKGGTRGQRRCRPDSVRPRHRAMCLAGRTWPSQEPSRGNSFHLGGESPRRAARLPEGPPLGAPCTPKPRHRGRGSAVSHAAETGVSDE